MVSVTSEIRGQVGESVVACNLSFRNQGARGNVTCPSVTRGRGSSRGNVTCPSITKEGVVEEGEM